MAISKLGSPGKGILPVAITDAVTNLSLSSVAAGSLPSSKRRTYRTSNVLVLSLVLVFVVATCTTYRVAPCYIGWMWHYENRCPAGQPHPWEEAPPMLNAVSQQQRNGNAPRIAVAMIADDFMHPDVRNLTIRNKKRYADTWGYDLFVPSKEELVQMAGDLPVAWVKFPLVKRVLETHDYVFVIDADAIILREDISLHKAAREMGDASLLISNDVNGPNSGGKFHFFCNAF